MMIVADKGHHPPGGCPNGAMMARRTLLKEGKLNTLSQIKNRRLALNKGYFVGEYFFEKLLGQVGLTSKDVEMVSIPFSMRSEAFEKGTIDIAFATEPLVTQLLLQGHAAVWIPLQQIYPNFQLSSVLYGPTLLEKNREAGKRFMLAYLKAVQQYNQGKTERNMKILIKHTRLDKEIIEKACWPAIRNNGLINIESILDFQSWALKKGALDKEIPSNQFWDPSFVEYASKVLYSSK